MFYSSQLFIFLFTLLWFNVVCYVNSILQAVCTKSLYLIKYLLDWRVAMPEDVENMREYREKMNNIILQNADKNIKRFFTQDSRVYEPGKLDKKTKELMGLVASTVLRCNDCIFYHLDQCYKENVTDEELYETLNIALIVGGSITIPHIRNIFEMWEQIKKF